jgi:hypothetical protein
MIESLVGLLLALIALAIGWISWRRRAIRWTPPAEVVKHFAGALGTGASVVRVHAGLAAEPGETVTLGVYWRRRWPVEGEHLAIYAATSPPLLDEEGRAVHLATPAYLLLRYDPMLQLSDDGQDRSEWAQVSVPKGTQLQLAGALTPEAPGGPYRAAGRVLHPIDGHLAAAIGDRPLAIPGRPRAAVVDRRVSILVTTLSAGTAAAAALATSWGILAGIAAVVAVLARNHLGDSNLEQHEARARGALECPPPSERAGICPRCSSPVWNLPGPKHKAWVDFGQCSGERTGRSCGFLVEYIEMNPVFTPAPITTVAAEAWAALPRDAEDPRAEEIAALVTTDPFPYGKYTRGRTVADAFERELSRGRLSRSSGPPSGPGYSPAGGA